MVAEVELPDNGRELLTEPVFSDDALDVPSTVVVESARVPMEKLSATTDPPLAL
jgi:hypothetical protein